MSRVVPREANVEEELYRLLMNVLEKKKYSIEGINFDRVEPQFPINGGRADLMLPIHPSKPLVVIECKKKVEMGGNLTIIRNFDPLSSRVINQALTYAVRIGASLFATTNGKVLALFLVPDRGEPFRIDRHRLFVSDIQLKESVVEDVLNLVARWKAGLKITKTPVDWAFIFRLRSFVEYLSGQLVIVVERKLKSDKDFKKRFDDFVREVGAGNPDTYSRESAYIIMNKIVFYKILERYYGKLTKMRPMPETSGSALATKLSERFAEAMNVTKDFESIFSTGIYDDVPFPDEQIVLDEINGFIEDMDTYRLEEIGSDIVGIISERLIPPEERHRLGQFYTPPQIAELIVKWAIREPTDKVLDPACGSGTFLVKAYGLLHGMKPLRTDYVHKELLEQLYGIDINSFPAHLTGVNLAMRDVRHPTSEMNVLVEDFFNSVPNQKRFAPFATKSPGGEAKREIIIPKINAVVANPPYTRWLEIAESTRAAIEASVGRTLRDFHLAARIRAGIETPIYIPFVIHASDFLNKGGRIGMIISNS